jgi:transcriptional regulator with XRE-family HTH domain
MRDRRIEFPPSLRSKILCSYKNKRGTEVPARSTRGRNNAPMIIGDRLREMRGEKKLSQGDIEKRTGLLRCYISRVENGHTVPAIETLEKLARALEIPLYQLFYEGEEPPEPPALLKRKSSDDNAWGSAGKEARYSASFVAYWPRRRKPIARYFSTWPRKCLIGSFA